MTDKDSRYRFVLEKTNVRGVVVNLQDTWREVLSRADYPPNVRRVLGHAMVAMPLLASTIKFEGKLTLQAKGSGPVGLLVVQADATGGQRGLAHWQSDPPESPLSQIFGDATLTIQIESGKRGEIYQGIVEATGDSLQDALGRYFENSEQLPTRLILHCNDQQAAGILIQQLPATADQPMTDDSEDDWNRISLMAATVGASELMESGISELLTRVFSEDEVRLFDAEPLRFDCRCSRERTAGLIEGLGRAEAEDILAEQEQIEIICEFCNAKQVFDSIDVDTIFRANAFTGSAPGDASGNIH